MYYNYSTTSKKMQSVCYFVSKKMQITYHFASKKMQIHFISKILKFISTHDYDHKLNKSVINSSIKEISKHIMVYNLQRVLLFSIK